MTNKSDSFVLRINLESPAAVYLQIADGIRALLVGGAFKAGDKLPTVRQLAVDLNVNHNTVAQAYRILAEEGWVELRRHHGVTVIPRAGRRSHPGRRSDFIQRLRELAARAIADGVDAKIVTKQLNSLAKDIQQSN